MAATVPPADDSSATERSEILEDAKAAKAARPPRTFVYVVTCPRREIKSIFRSRRRANAYAEHLRRLPFSSGKYFVEKLELRN
jgi:hypothetical protein